MQQSLKPYKLEDNNKIEFLGLVAGTITMYCGLVFIQEDSIYGFYQFAGILVFLFNFYFLIHWTYMILCSIEWKNHNYQRFLKIYALILCRKHNSTFSTTTENSKSITRKSQFDKFLDNSKPTENTKKKILKRYDDEVSSIGSFQFYNFLTSEDFTHSLWYFSS